MVKNIFWSMTFKILKRHKTRTLLAVLGIIIGVVAISSIGIFGTGLQLSTERQFEDMANEIHVTPNRKKGYEFLTREQNKNIERIVSPAEVIPIYQEPDGKGQIREERVRFTVYGLKPETIAILFEVQTGRTLRGNKPQCLVGYDFADDHELRVGSSVYIEGKPISVKGVLEKVQGAAVIYPNNALILAERTYEDVYSPEGYDWTVIKADKLERVGPLEELLRANLNKHKDTVSIRTMSDIIATITEVVGTIAITLAAIGAISLLVAGIGIANVMLMSVMEETRNIGIMRAIGAYPGEIKNIFLYESLLLGCASSLVGTLLSIASGYLLNIVLLPTFIGADSSSVGFVSPLEILSAPGSLVYMGLGFAFGIFVTMICSLYPALKASKVDPIIALRAE